MAFGPASIEEAFLEMLDTALAGDDLVFVDEVVRSPSGKADYRWAREVVARQA